MMKIVVRSDFYCIPEMEKQIENSMWRSLSECTLVLIFSIVLTCHLGAGEYN